MKIVICSDSHGDNETLDKIVAKNKDADLYLHAGDSESEELAIMPFLSVRGNCDYFSTFPERRIIQTPYGKLLIQHHPITDMSFLIKESIKIVITGHTHIRKEEIINHCIFINPGAISFSRDGFDMSYAIVEIDEKNVRVTYKTLL